MTDGADTPRRADNGYSHHQTSERIARSAREEAELSRRRNEARVSDEANSRREEDQEREDAESRARIAADEDASRQRLAEDKTRHENIRGEE